jgi:hypothetical protein
MAKTFRVNIPSKKYLKKYLIILFQGDFHLSRSDHHIKVFLFYLLERKAPEKFKMDNAKFQCNDVLTFTIGTEAYHRYGWDLPKDKIIRFNDYLEEHFREALYNFVAFKTAFGIKKKQAIEDFADRYNITPDDVDYDSIRRMYDRFCKKYLPLPFIAPANKQPSPIHKHHCAYRIQKAKKQHDTGQTELF